MERVPSPPDVLTKPLDVRLEILLMLGADNVGDVPNTRLPDPVSSDSAPDIPDEVVVAVTGEVPLPINTPVNDVAPVPPWLTATVPVTLAAFPVISPEILDPAREVIQEGSA